MKAHYYYHPTADDRQRENLWRTAQFIGVASEPFNKYLSAVLQIDIQSVSSCVEVLQNIDKVERGQLQNSGWSGNAFDTLFDEGGVEIERTLFSGHPDWPSWGCTLPQFKEALIGWKQFLELPKSMDSTVISEISMEPKA